MVYGTGIPPLLRTLSLVTQHLSCCVELQQGDGADSERREEQDREEWRREEKIGKTEEETREERRRGEESQESHPLSLDMLVSHGRRVLVPTPPLLTDSDSLNLPFLWRQREEEKEGEGVWAGEFYLLQCSSLPLSPPNHPAENTMAQRK